MASTVEQLVNQGLMAAGLTRRVANIFDGSEEAKVALEEYGQARDELLDLKDWSFSRQVAALTLLKGPPPNGGYSPSQPWSNLYPYPGFLYEYAYPSDCLDLRAIMPYPGPMPDLDPVPQLWRVDNDLLPSIVDGVATGPAQKVIYANATDAIAVYRARVVNPSQFDTGFVSALVASLGKKFAVAFGENINVEQARQANAIGTAQTESSLRG